MPSHSLLFIIIFIIAKPGHRASGTCCTVRPQTHPEYKAQTLQWCVLTGSNVRALAASNNSTHINRILNKNLHVLQPIPAPNMTNVLQS